jgi:bacteriorhodopsin
VQETSGYRKLSGYENEAGGYEHPSYAGQPYIAGTHYHIVQPRGTIDTTFNTLGRSGRIVLWVTFGLFYCFAGFFFWRAFKCHKCACHPKISERYHAFLSQPLFLSGVICLIAALSYLSMAAEVGFYTRCCDGRQFFFARYIDWVLTTPLLLHTIVYFAGACDDTFIYLFFMDILMIVSGLIGSLVCDDWKWFFFGFAILTFIPILHYICHLKSCEVNSRFDYALFFWNYGNMCNLTAFIWFLYPVVFVLAEIRHTLSVNGETFFYAILDFFSKIVLSLLVANCRCIYTLDHFDERELFNALEGAGMSIRGKPRYGNEYEESKKHSKYGESPKHSKYGESPKSIGYGDSPRSSHRSY